MKTKSISKWVVLIFATISLTASCNKEKLDDPIPNVDVVDTRSTIDISTFISWTQNDADIISMIFEISRDGKNVYKWRKDSFRADETVNKQIKFDLEAGDQLILAAYGDFQNGYQFNGEIKVNGKSVKAGQKICTYFSLIYTLP